MGKQLQKVRTVIGVMVIMLFGIITNSLAQEVSINGTVTDAEASQTLPGVNVIVKGTSIGTSTNVEGNYELNVPSLQDTLIFSFVGYQTKEVPISGQETIDVVMQSQAVAGDEVVVVGYGTQKEENLTGAVSSVQGSDKLASRPITNLGQGLQGAIPNLNIDFSDGAPGTEPSFNVRGFTSTNGGEPLVLVDGVEMDPSLLNPNEVESVSVLKDASAAAVYGSRAAFGVVLITTKKGRKGQKPKVDVSTSFSMNRPTEIPDLVDSRQYIQFREEKAANLGQGAPFNEETKALLLAYYNDPANNPSARINPNDPTQYQYFGNTDWFATVFENYSPLKKTNISLSGSTDNITYYLSGGLLDQAGILKFGNDSYNRSNLRAKFDVDATDWLTFKVNSVLTTTQQDQIYNYAGIGTVWHDLTRKSIFRPLTNPDGTNTPSTVAFLKDGGRDRMAETDAWVTLDAVVNPFEGLQITGSYSYNNFTSERKQHRKRIEMYTGPSELNTPNTTHTTPTALFLDDIRNDYYAINIYGEYEKQFLEDHNIKVTLGFNEEKKEFHFTNSGNQSLLTDQLPSINLTTATPTVGETITSWALQGYFYRLNYILKDRYLLEFNGRYDATSRYPSEDRWGFFPSVSAGWIISEESFMQPLQPTISKLKIRGSWGQLGNQSVIDETSSTLNFPYLPTLEAFRPGAILGGDRPLSVMDPLLVSSSLTWETATSKNIGVDVGMFDSRLDFSFDYFERLVTDQLGPSSSVPATLGTEAPRSNAVESVTKGWEFEGSWRGNIGEVNYNVGFNIADSYAEVTKYNNPTKSLAAPFYEGQRIGEIWGYKTNGLFDSRDEYLSSGLDYSNRTGLQIEGGDVWFVDQNGDGIIDQGNQTVGNSGDLTVIGNTIPRYTYGINLGAAWKGVSLDVFMQGVAKRDLALNGGLFWPNENGTPQVNHLDYWTEDNKGAYWPRALGNQGGFNYATSDRYLQDFSYLRMKQLTLAYSFSNSLLEKTLLKSARVYVTGQNLFELDNVLSGFDPEISSGGFNGWGSGKSYPFQRSVSLGIDVSF
ncbi:SusC/RagA family TonB-linked outer membrane protein [Fodinibius salsisoli]|uniref:TonB-dependent receptor n=1 Tax=Fodinibius salsisoli TaxID=2820877 RepID=A0ABT3PPX5_9BACT|nr:TonB-dependent receptor [Fodinibius salsisoli]MCW9707912.1 TonB-dependent receptor [Fodinibius salsisoli]